ncbi:MAG: large conductance mechanosensitive channel protein MscL [Chlorobiaceae bacterium]|jgi:large conductance mechanosensitive channel|nr:large conductance mechanosensitive channel protein MscL [Chlorobiaceae bacterium]
MLKEFKDFAVRGNVVDMAVGIIIGAAFTTIINTLVNEVVMPPIGLLLGGVDFSNFYLLLKEGSKAAPYESLAAAKSAGAVTLSYGILVNACISFFIVTFVMFLSVKGINRLKAKEAAAPDPSVRECPFCCSQIPVKAKRCPMCTSELK